MFTYADPRACPGCRAPLTQPALSCTACGLSLTGPAPRQVFEALSYVDRLVAAMYAEVPTPSDGPAAAPTTGAVAVPRPATAPSYARTGLSAASVPRILLGLGALCLLVAAVVFLAVAWAALGVGGRTAVLAVLTAVAAGLMAWLAGRDLRAGSESFAAVALGLLALDLGGAWRAGWLGTLGDEPFVVVAGLVVAGAGAAAGRWTATTPVGTVVSAQVVGAVAVLAASLGVPGTVDRGDAVGVLGGLAVCAVGAALGHGVGLRVLALGAALGAVGWWWALVGVGIGRLDELSVARVWGELAVWPLLVATALVAVVAVPRRVPTEARVGAAAVAILLGTTVVTVVSFDESATRVALAQLAVIAAYAVLAARLPGAWRWICAAPSVVAALGLAASVALLVSAALPVLVLHDPWGSGALSGLAAPDVPWSWPLLLPVGVAGIAVATSTVLRCAGRRPGSAVVPGAALALAALALVPPLYGVPLLLAVVVLLLLGGALAVGGAVLDRVVVMAPAAVTLLLALGTALASDWGTAGTLGVLTAAAVSLEVVPPRTWRDVGAALAPLTGAGLLWTLGHLVDLPVEARALPVLLVLGVAVVLVPRVGREVAAAVAAVCAVAASVLATGSPDQTWLAVHLTVAGVIATASSLVNTDRRRLAWVAVACLTGAQWVRLQQLGVDTVEAYTLPLALVLLIVGVVAMRRGDDSSVRALAPGLTLGLVPTLLLVLLDPVDLRAVLLGLACLVLVAAGVSQGWSAPLVAGAVTGALVVLRESTFAQVLPQWVLIGLVGVLLTVVGVTWEQRLRELHRVSAYVRALR